MDPSYELLAERRLWLSIVPGTVLSASEVFIYLFSKQHVEAAVAVIYSPLFQKEVTKNQRLGALLSSKYQDPAMPGSLPPQPMVCFGLV